MWQHLETIPKSKFKSASLVRVKALRADPVIWSFLSDVDERNDARRQVGIDSPAARVFGIERNSLLSKFRRSWYQRVEWLTTTQGGGLSIKEAAEKVNLDYSKEAQEDKAGAVALYRTLLNRDTDSISWHSLSELWGRAVRSSRATTRGATPKSLPSAITKDGSTYRMKT
jgi:hypothetical protein